MSRSVISEPDPVRIPHTAGVTVSSSMLRAIKVPVDDLRAEALRQAMNDELMPRYADRPNADLSRLEGRTDHPAGFIAPETVIATVLILDDGDVALGHGMLRDLTGEPEIKRLYVTPEARGSGAANLLMQTLEDAARANSSRRAILQTGDRQPEAEALYRRRGWTRIPIYPPYLSVEFSRCYEKSLL